MRVVFVQKFVPHYRLPMFEQLRENLAKKDVEFVLLYGPPDAYEGSKVKTMEPPWGLRVNSRIFSVLGRYLYWQGANKHIKKGDLVIVEHAAKLLDNYVIFAKRQFGGCKMAYFGHGKCFQPKVELFISRWVKKLMLRKVDRWFAYTEVSRQSLLEQDVSDDIISVVNNTLLSPIKLESLESKKVPDRFIYIGGMYKDKRIEVLLESAKLIKERRPEFELHCVGDGPLRHLITAEAANNDWILDHGALYGEERNELLASSVGILMPGLVGLVIMDAFFFQCPIITSSSGEHSPEIAYLENGVNGIIENAGASAQAYADTVVDYLHSPQQALEMRAACLASAERYSMDNMEKNFRDGILTTL